MDDRIQTLQRFGANDSTFVTPAGIAFVLLAIVLIFVLPRKHMIVPLLAVAFFLPLGQKLVLGPLHFHMLRIVLIFAWVRVLMSGYLAANPIRLTLIDKAVIYWAIAASITFCLLWGEFGAVINRLGFLYNTFGLYFLLRVLLRDRDDFDRIIKVFAVISAIIAVCMFTEQVTGRNLFAAFGGVPEFTDIRDGSLRSQGAFAHPILAGTYGGIMLPLFLGMWWQRKSRALALLGIAAAAVIVVTASSSTAVSAAGAGIAAMFFWRFRRWTRPLRWATLLTLVALHMVMKAPVWALIDRMDFTGSSSGYHRYQLVNMFILNFREWWLVGVRDTGHWGYDMWDTSNQYVDVGVTGGLISLILFLMISVRCFSAAGKLRIALRDDPNAQKQAWTMGAMLFAIMVGFFGISFFDQTMVAWYALTAMISGFSLELKTRAKLEPVSNRETTSDDWKPLEEPVLAGTPLRQFAGRRNSWSADRLGYGNWQLS